MGNPAVDYEFSLIWDGADFSLNIEADSLLNIGGKKPSINIILVNSSEKKFCEGDGLYSNLNT